ncbi:MAG: CbiX/SirB N-terminal domain-containing protein, partial [Elusimicrobiota bacterium]|nr:CbiX/SirB N-terminal domain-containing protein [Elusimicrobiota bacterium]
MTRSIIKKIAIFALAFFCCGAAHSQEYKHPGLLVLSHGSSSLEVNNKVEDMVARIRKENNEKKLFHAVENAFLEVGQPTARTGVERLQKAGCDRIIVVPFFTSQDGHTQDDIPVVMGLSSNPEVIEELKGEGIALANPTVFVVITKTLNETNVLADFIKSEVASMSKKSKEEALVVISLEANDYRNIVFPTINNATKAAAQSKDIKKYKDVYSWQDETFWTNVTPTLKEFSKTSRRVIITS